MASPLLIPVDRRGSHFVISDEWIKSGLDFPSVEEKLALLNRGYKTSRGIVHYEGVARRAVILIPAAGDDQIYADLLPEADDPSEALQILEEAKNEYIEQVRNDFGYSEGVLPEQKLRIDSEFVEPLLQAEHEGEYIPWGRLRPESYLFIIGEPGSGKTTLLRQWLLWHAARAEKGESEILPVCLQLRNLRPGEGLESAFRRTLADAGSRWLADDLIPLAQKGQIAFALDGLDEVPSEDRVHLARDLQRFTSTFARCKYMLTSRPTVDVKLQIGLERVHVRPFDDKRLNEIAFHKLYDNMEWRKFSCKIKSEPALDVISRSPLVYSFIISNFMRSSVYPTYLSETVGSLVELLVDRWDSSRGIIRSRDKVLSAGATYKVLTALAGLKQASPPEDSIARLYERVNHLFPDQSAFTTLQAIRDNTGLIHYSEIAGWTFRHDIFEEYFSAHSWVSSLSGRLKAFVKELLKPVTGKSASFRRFVGYMSSDASLIIENTLRSASVNDKFAATNLAYVLSQRMPLSNHVVEGFAQLVVSSLATDVSERRITPIEAVEGISSPRLLLEIDSPDRRSRTKELITALYSCRDGAGGAAIQSALLLQEQQVYLTLAALLQVEGRLVAREHESSVEMYVADPASNEAIEN